nr:acyltransferase [Sphingobium nicotianae]
MLEIDALRGIGALAVLVFHFTSRYPEMLPNVAAVDIKFPGGHYGVMLFFALSGFAIHFSFKRLEHVGDFIVARFARLFPAYWAAMACTLIVEYFAGPPQLDIPLLDQLVNPTMLQSYAGLASVDGAYWTLGVELAFYGCMAALWRFRLLKRLEPVLFLWLATRWLMELWPAVPELAAQGFILRYIQYFAIGLIAYRVHAGQRSWRQQAPLIGFLFVTLAVFESIGIVIVGAALQLLFALVVAGRLRFIAVRPLLIVGAMSYPLYLVHQHVGMTIMFRADRAGWNPYVGLLLATVAVGLIGWCIHKYVERPGGDFILRKWRGHVETGHELVPMERGRLIELDLLRGIGALLVINFHYSTRFHEMFPNEKHVAFHMIGGNYRVMLFFAISGFAIFFSMRKLTDARDFVIGRMARLYPAYWVAILLTTSFEHMADIRSLEVSTTDIFVNLSMLQGFFYMPAVDGAYWTLTIELAFYFCAIVLWRLNCFKRIELILLPWLALKLAAHLVPVLPTRVETLLVLRWIPFFAIGLLSYRVWAGERGWRDQLVYFLAVILTVTLTETPDVIVAALILGLTFVLMIEGYLHRLCFRPLLWLGGISYSLYLVHQNIGYTVMVVGNRLGVSPNLSFAVAVVTAMALGALVNRTIERPATRIVAAWWRNYRRPAVVAHAAQAVVAVPVKTDAGNA